ncbi:hypothetical protein MSG28_015914 [Choristoneura fumiferana]|uniref:Uncharacterized protein n=1 Tax=Choristoneura fumiferana TaxID=7141 RepID=A0ACC0K566_CHOFU|nr:hypothetical protein MSG28_015914 [Choristoneura fumiferana]
MRVSVALLVLFAVHNASEEIKTTLRIDERVRILKQNLKKKLQMKHSLKIQPIDDPVEYGSYEHDDSPVTPILESDERKRDDKFKLRKLKTIPLPPSTSPWLKTVKKREPKHSKRVRERNRKPKTALTHHTIAPVSKPSDIFYRKSYTSNIDMNEPIPWLHCAHMVSPYLSRAKKELTKPIEKTKDDHVVFRLLQLLSMNTTDFTKEEIYSVLYQISKLKIRFFSWNVEAMKMLFNVLTKDDPGNPDRVHNFKSIKSGLKRLFDSWHLDRSNTTRLLLQARVFRPPCISKEHTGSSRFVPGNTLNPPLRTTDNSDDEASADCQNRAHDHVENKPSGN